MPMELAQQALHWSWQQEMQLRNARHREAATCRRRRLAPSRPRRPSPAVSSASITPAAGGTRPSAHGYTTDCSASRAATAAGVLAAGQSWTSWSRSDAPSTTSWGASVVPYAMGARGVHQHRERAVLVPRSWFMRTWTLSRRCGPSASGPSEKGAEPRFRDNKQRLHLSVQESAIPRLGR